MPAKRATEHHITEYESDRSNEGFTHRRLEGPLWMVSLDLRAWSKAVHKLEQLSQGDDSRLGLLGPQRFQAGSATDYYMATEHLLATLKQHLSSLGYPAITYGDCLTFAANPLQNSQAQIEQHVFGIMERILRVKSGEFGAPGEGDLRIQLPRFDFHPLEFQTTSSLFLIEEAGQAALMMQDGLLRERVEGHQSMSPGRSSRRRYASPSRRDRHPMMPQARQAERLDWEAHDSRCIGAIQLDLTGLVGQVERDDIMVNLYCMIRQSVPNQVNDDLSYLKCTGESGQLTFLFQAVDPGFLKQQLAYLAAEMRLQISQLSQHQPPLVWACNEKTHTLHAYHDASNPGLGDYYCAGINTVMHVLKGKRKPDTSLTLQVVAAHQNDATMPRRDWIHPPGMTASIPM